MREQTNRYEHVHTVTVVQATACNKSREELKTARGLIILVYIHILLAVYANALSVEPKFAYLPADCAEAGVFAKIKHILA